MVVGHGVARERAGGDDRLTLGYLGELALLDLDVRAGAQASRLYSAEKPSRSTARAPPAATRFLSADSMMREPRRRISSLSRPTALVSSSLRREFEHTSSAKSGETCAGAVFARLHLHKAHGDAAPGQLPGALAACEPRARHCDGPHSAASVFLAAAFLAAGFFAAVLAAVFFAAGFFAAVLAAVFLAAGFLAAVLASASAVSAEASASPSAGFAAGFFL